MELKGKKISVIGMGRSGSALVKVLYELGAEVFISENKSRPELEQFMKELEGKIAGAEFGGQTSKIYDDKDMIVISPGVSIHHPIIQKALQSGVSVISEIELAYRLTKCPIIAVTGTNGKSTTTTLIGRLIEAGGSRAIVAGNIGIPLIGEIQGLSSDTWIAAEISSFQLEAVAEFKPRISVLLNITSDHLDRHKSFAEYVEHKRNLFKNQGANDYAVLNADDREVMNLLPSIKCGTYFFSRKGTVERGAFLEEGWIKIAGDSGIIPVIKCDDLSLKGPHNIENVMAACTAAYLTGIDIKEASAVLKTVRGLEHRLQLVSVIGGVKFVDDSKGTNPGAVIAALQSFNEPMILIAGGKDKDMDFHDLARVIASKAKDLILLGESGEKIRAAVEEFDFKKVHQAKSMDEAVELAYSLAELEDVVLLSPACASFDMFKSAEHRGEVFIEAVKRLEGRAIEKKS